MTQPVPRWRRFARGGLLAILGALLLAAWHPGERSQIGAGLEGRLLDLRFQIRGPLPPPDTVAMVVFDDLAVSRLQTFPPSRSDIAEAVRSSFAAGASVVALDLLLVDRRDTAAGLAGALKAGPTVLGVAEAPPGADPTPLIDPHGFGLIIGTDPRAPLPAMGPDPTLQGHAALGHVTVQHDADGALRRMRPALTVLTPDGTRTVPGLAVAALSAVTTPGNRPELVLPRAGAPARLTGNWPVAWLDRNSALPLNFLGPGGTIPTVSAAVLAETDLGGKVVFLGATATGFGDRHATSFDSNLPGVELHATLAANLLGGATLRRDMPAWGFGAGLAMALAVAGYWAGGLQQLWLVFPATLAVVAAALLALQVTFTQGWWLDATTVLAALFMGLAIGGTQRIVETKRRAANLARFQSPRLVEALAAHSSALGVREPHPAVVVFVDVAGFTTLAEGIGPGEAARFLRAYHEMVEAAADPYGGAIMDFAGDGVLVVFGAPEPASDDASRALRFIERLFEDADRNDIALRAGGHSGVVQLSFLGGTRHRTVSISGDVVNTASRLQDAAKRLDAALVVSGAFLDGLDDRARRGFEPVGETFLRGRSAPVSVWMKPMTRNAPNAR